MPPPFLDTNILVNHLLQEQAEHGARATAILERIEAGELSVRTSDLVVFETVFTLQRAYRIPRERIAAGILSILQMKGVLLPSKSNYRRVFNLYVSTNIGFADCYHAMLMERLGINEVFSFDRDFDKLPGLSRREA
jgi:predicted nucleic acid-binding protein